MVILEKLVILTSNQALFYYIIEFLSWNKIIQRKYNERNTESYGKIMNYFIQWIFSFTIFIEDLLPRFQQLLQDVIFLGFLRRPKFLAGCCPWATLRFFAIVASCNIVIHIHSGIHSSWLTTPQNLGILEIKAMLASLFRFGLLSSVPKKFQSYKDEMGVLFSWQAPFNHC